MRGAPDPEPHDLEGYAKRERRMAKKLLVFGGGFIVLGVLYWNWSAARDWQRLKADLEAKGVHGGVKLIVQTQQHHTRAGMLGGMQKLGKVEILSDARR